MRPATADTRAAQRDGAAKLDATGGFRAGGGGCVRGVVRRCREVDARRRLLGRLGRPPTWPRHSCGDGFLRMGEKPGGI